MKTKLRTPIIISSLVIVTGLCAAAWGAFHSRHGASPPPGPDDGAYFAQGMTYAVRLRLDGDRLMFAGEYGTALERYQEAALYDPFYDSHMGVRYRRWFKIKLGRVLDEDEVRATDDDNPSASALAAILSSTGVNEIAANMIATEDVDTEGTSRERITTSSFPSLADARRPTVCLRRLHCTAPGSS